MKTRTKYSMYLVHTLNVLSGARIPPATPNRAGLRSLEKSGKIPWRQIEQASVFQVSIEQPRMLAHQLTLQDTFSGAPHADEYQGLPGASGQGVDQLTVDFALANRQGFLVLEDVE